MFATILELLQLAAATADTAVRARAAYLKAKEQALRDKQLTPEQSAELDARAEKYFADAKSHRSGR